MPSRDTHPVPGYGAASTDLNLSRPLDVIASIFGLDSQAGRIAHLQQSLAGISPHAVATWLDDIHAQIQVQGAAG